MNTRVKEILESKDKRLVAIGPQATVREAIEKMVDNDVGAIVVAEGPTIVGVFTERDYLKRIILQGRTSSDTRVAEVMSSGLLSVNVDDTIEDCISVMTDQRVRHLLVFDDDRFCGLVSIGDCVALLRDQLALENGYLREYISGPFVHAR